MPEEPVIRRRKEAQKRLDAAVAKKGFETVASGSATKNEEISNRVEPQTGLWKKSERSKPSRLMIHIDAANPEDPEISFLETGGRILGVVNLNTGNKKKILLSFRVYANVKVGTTYKGEIEWDWLLWVATKHPLPPDSTSTLVENLDLENGKLTVAKKEQSIVGVGLIALCPPETPSKSVEGLHYGTVTQKLITLIRSESRPSEETKSNG